MSGVLITGGAGYIGSHLLHRMKDLYYPSTVTCYDSLTAPNSGFVPDYDGFRYGNIKDTGQVGLCCSRAQIDTVVHLAARIDVNESMIQPERYYRVNAAYTANVVQGAARSGVKNFILASTAAVYGPSDRPVTETAPVTPTNPYGKSKLAAEWIAQDICRQYGIRCVVLRFFNVAGADWKLRSGQMHKDSLFKVLTQALLADDPTIPVYGDDHPTDDGYAIRDYVGVEDIAASIFKIVSMLENGHNLAGIYNLGTGRGVSVNEVVSMFETVTGKKVRRMISPRRPGEVSYAVADVTKASEAGLLPVRTTLASLVERAWSWELQLKEGVKKDV